MGAKENRETIERYYHALANGDFEALAAIHSDDVVFNLVGQTPVSGRFVGKNVCFGEVISEKVLGALVPGKFKFAKKWRIMAADDNCVVGIMQGGGLAKNGIEYAQTYCQVFTMRNGKITELHEFFDTVLAEAALFDNHLEKQETGPAQPFDL